MKRREIEREIQRGRQTYRKRNEKTFYWHQSMQDMLAHGWSRKKALEGRNSWIERKTKVFKILSEELKWKSFSLQCWNSKVLRFCEALTPWMCVCVCMSYLRAPLFMGQQQLKKETNKEREKTKKLTFCESLSDNISFKRKHLKFY